MVRASFASEAMSDIGGAMSDTGDMGIGKSGRGKAKSIYNR